MFSKQKEKTKCALVAAIMSYIIIPVFLMIVENIIPLILILIVTVIMVILTRYGCKLMDKYLKVSNERSKERLKERRDKKAARRQLLNFKYQLFFSLLKNVGFRPLLIGIM